MKRDLRAWVLASALLLLAALAGAAAVRQHWIPCRGSMLSGSALNGYRYGPEFSDGCLQAMDSGFGLVDSSPGGAWSAELALGTGAILVLALAWLAVVSGSGWSTRSKRWSLLPALASVGSLVLNVDAVADALGGSSLLLLIAPNLCAVAAFAVIWAEERPGAVVMFQVALALSASTAVGLAAAVADYAFMVSFSDANWDAPPGSGYLTVFGVALTAVVLFVVTLVRHSARLVEERVMTPAEV